MLEELTKIICEGCNHITKELCGLDLVMDEAGLMREYGHYSGPVVNIGFFGDYAGQVHFSFKNRLAVKMAGAMTGMDISDMHDDLAQSALGELCNMIMGNALGMVNERLGLYLDITPPSVVIDGKPGNNTKSCSSVRVLLSLNGENEMDMCILAPFTS